MNAPPQVAVVGGGISGLAAAALLARDGMDVELFEQGELGGRAGRWAADGFRFDTGPSWYLMPEVFSRFFELMGTSVEAELDLIGLDPAYRVYYEDHPEPVDISARTADNLATFEAIEPGAGARLGRYLASAADTYDIAKRRFLYTSFTSPWDLARPDVLTRVHRLVPLLLRSLQSRIERDFADRRLQQILGYPAVFLGTSPDRAPSLYHLMSALDLNGGVLYPDGGFARLIDVIAATARRAGVRIHTGARVEAILTDDEGGGRVRGVRFRQGEQLLERAARWVVAAADLHHVEHDLLDPRLRERSRRWWSRHDPGPGGVLVYLGVRGTVPQLAHHSLFFTRDWQRNFADIRMGRVPDPASVYVCAPSKTDASVAPAGDENLFILVPVPADPGIGRGGRDGGGDPAVERIADAAIDLVADYADIPDLRERILLRRTSGPGDFADRFNSWRGGLLGPAHTLRQSAFFRTSNRSRRVEGLYFAGASTIPGVGLPMCLISAENVRDRIRSDRSRAAAPGRRSRS
ncbi:phytoene desaturase family protein [Pseudactinotalea sp. HY158]|uniref:phytoene desaturase family protein n=1 Tax=Pseudactinotalea sp. HY158 TaxID=2654547 RepID=UPI00129CE914|nr:phytoene desaturase family protein [Pseudactinotalea sp. HY158]QGH70203.1 phytoene desaturase [Pseudactinotalea sp. HY158]